MNAVIAIAPELKVEGTVLQAKWQSALVDMRIELGLRTVGRLTLRFSDPGYELSTTSVFKVGAKVLAKMAGGDDLVTAYVTGVAVEQRDGLPPELVIIAHDVAYKLTSQSKVRTFPKAKYSDALTKIFGEAGIKGEVESTREIFEYSLQAGTDLDFLDQVADRLGWDWRVDGESVVVGSPGKGAPTVSRALGEELYEFSVRASDLRPTAIKVNGWDRKTKREVVGQASISASTVAAQSTLVDTFHRGGSRNAITAERTPGTQEEATTLAKAVADEVAASTVLARGRGQIDGKLKPGVKLTVTNAGPVSGTYHLTEVEHIYRTSGFETRFVAGERRPTTLVDVLSGPAGNSGFSHSGLLVGIVTNNDDPDKRGRVKVKFPTVSQDIESAWARVAVIGGGASRGMMSVPEVNDEVLVGFEAGDPRFPVVLGGLHSGKDLAPAYKIANGKVDNRQITSRLGHVIEFGDGAGQSDQHVLLGLAEGKHKLRLGKDKMDIELPSGVPLKITVGNSFIQVDGQGNITLSGQKIDLKAQQGVTVNGMTVELKANTSLKAEGTMVAVKGSATTTVEASGPLVLKGALVKIN